jgi:hypothetical protein
MTIGSSPQNQTISSVCGNYSGNTVYKSDVNVSSEIGRPFELLDSGYAFFPDDSVALLLSEESFMVVDGVGNSFSLFPNGTIGVGYNCHAAYSTVNALGNSTIAARRRSSRRRSSSLMTRALENEFPIQVYLFDQCYQKIQRMHPNVNPRLACVASSNLDDPAMDVTGSQLTQKPIFAGTGIFDGSCGFPDFSSKSLECQQIYEDLKATCDSSLAQFIFKHQQGLCLGTGIAVAGLADVLSEGATAAETKKIQEIASALCATGIRDSAALCGFVSKSYTPALAEGLCKAYDAVKNGLRTTYVEVIIIVDEAYPDTERVQVISVKPDPYLGIVPTAVFTFSEEDCNSPSTVPSVSTPTTAPSLSITELSSLPSPTATPAQSGEVISCSEVPAGQSSTSVFGGEYDSCFATAGNLYDDLFGQCLDEATVCAEAMNQCEIDCGDDVPCVEQCFESAECGEDQEDCQNDAQATANEAYADCGQYKDMCFIGSDDACRTVYGDSCESF